MVRVTVTVTGYSNFSSGKFYRTAKIEVDQRLNKLSLHLHSPVEYSIIYDKRPKHYYLEVNTNAYIYVYTIRGITHSKIQKKRKTSSPHHFRLLTHNAAHRIRVRT